MYCRSAVIQSFTKTVSLLTFLHSISSRRQPSLPPELSGLCSQWIFWTKLATRAPCHPGSGKELWWKISTRHIHSLVGAPEGPVRLTGKEIKMLGWDEITLRSILREAMLFQIDLSRRSSRVSRGQHACCSVWPAGPQRRKASKSNLYFTPWLPLQASLLFLNLTSRDTLLAFLTGKWTWC